MAFGGLGCSPWSHLEDVRDGVVEMLPLLRVEVLQLGGVLVLALVSCVRPGVELVLGLNGAVTSTDFTSIITVSFVVYGKGQTVARGKKGEGEELGVKGWLKTGAAAEPYPLHI